MTTVTFYKSGDIIRGFSSSGHTSYAESGEDIVCAAISSATIMAVNTVTDIQHLDADVTVDDGFLELKLSSEDAVKATVILQGLLLHLNALVEQYNSYLELKFSEV